MKQILYTILILLFFNSCSHNKKTLKTVTVIFYDNQNPGLETKIDTLLDASEIDISVTPIDLFFCHEKFQIPYHVPTDGIYKNPAKDKECDMEIYPANVKCYEYDTKNRAIKMSVNGSGAMHSFTYQYNDIDQIIELRNHGHEIYQLTYNENGTLAELVYHSGDIKKRLIFIYA